MGGDCTANFPVYLSPAALGCLKPRWAALPWCADAVSRCDEEDEEAGEEVGEGEQAEVARLAAPTGASEGAVVSAGQRGRQRVIVAPRRLLAFAAGEDEQEALRRQLLFGCC